MDVLILTFQFIPPPYFHPGNHKFNHKGFPRGSDGKASAYNAEDPGSIPGSEDPLEKERATHCSMLAWEILWTEEPGSPRGRKKSDMA